MSNQQHEEHEKRLKAEENAPQLSQQRKNIQKSFSQSEQRILDLEQEIESLRKENKALSTQIKRFQERLASYKRDDNLAKETPKSFADQLANVKPTLLGEVNEHKGPKANITADAPKIDSDTVSTEAMERTMTAHFGRRQISKKKHRA